MANSLTSLFSHIPKVAFEFFHCHKDKQKKKKKKFHHKSIGYSNLKVPFIVETKSIWMSDLCAESLTITLMLIPIYPRTRNRASATKQNPEIILKF
jgi:hypothetical protein